MTSSRGLLLEILKQGALKIDEVERRIYARRDVLGFGVEAEDIISAAVAEGIVVAISDGGKTYLRIPAPFVKLERVYHDIEYLTYKAEADFLNGYQRFGIKPTEGQIAEIRWADGTITNETIVQEANNFRRIPGFHALIRGVKVWVPLDHPGIKVRADAF